MYSSFTTSCTSTKGMRRRVHHPRRIVGLKTSIAAESRRPVRNRFASVVNRILRYPKAIWRRDEAREGLRLRFQTANR